MQSALRSILSPEGALQQSKSEMFGEKYLGDLEYDENHSEGDDVADNGSWDDLSEVKHSVDLGDNSNWRGMSDVDETIDLDAGAHNWSM